MAGASKTLSNPSNQPDGGRLARAPRAARCADAPDGGVGHVARGVLARAPAVRVADGLHAARDEAHGPSQAAGRASAAGAAGPAGPGGGADCRVHQGVWHRQAGGRALEHPPRPLRCAVGCRCSQGVALGRAHRVGGGLARAVGLGARHFARVCQLLHRLVRDRQRLGADRADACAAPLRSSPAAARSTGVARVADSTSYRLAPHPLGASHAAPGARERGQHRDCANTRERCARGGADRDCEPPLRLGGAASRPGRE
eukprot:2949807-Prymnesium_polylepis.1